MRRADQVLQRAAGTAFTAAVARIEHRGQLAFERAYGTTRLDALAKPVYVDTPFDLASITKVFVSTLALGAVAEGRMALDEPLLRERITLRMLLAHTSGMQSGADFRMLMNENVEVFALEREAAALPGERVIYSDLGFIAAGVFIERAYGASLTNVMGRLRRSPVFRPGAGQRSQIPATEDDGWRGRVQGVVHDEKAYLMGGIAGHAGLFGTALDVAWLAEQYLAVVHGRPSVVQPHLAREAVSEQAYDAVLRRGLGWALKTTDENSCGRYFSPDSFGHTGFVGTCVWTDPQRDCTGVLLTNSVYFGRSDARDLRAAFYEAAIEDLGLR